MNLKEILLKGFYRLIARYYIKNPFMTDWIYERYQRPANLFRLLVNYMYYFFRITRPPYLLTATIDVITKCNLKCPMCRGVYSVLEQFGPMPLEFYEKILRRLPRSIESILLTQSGEPFLHPHIFEIIELTTRYGFRPIIFTNGTLLTEELSQRILKSSLDTLNISTELDEQNSMQFRGISLDSLEQKIHSIIKLKRDIHSPVKIKLSTVVHRQNKLGLAAFLKKWKYLVDGIKVNPMYLHLKKQRSQSCGELWRGHLSIRINGVITPCCCDLLGDFNIGNIQATDALIAWNGQRFRDLCYRISHNKFPELCYYCTWDETAGIKRIPV